MTKLLRSDIDREEAVKPLINGFKVPKLSEACRILFVNGDSLALSIEFGQTGLVSLQGSTQGNIEGSDLLIAESETQLIAIIQQALPQFIEKLTKIHHLIERTLISMISFNYKSKENGLCINI